MNNLTLGKPVDRTSAWDLLLLEIADAVSLPASEYERIEGHYKAISEILEDPNDPNLADAVIFPQGSFLTRTVIRAPANGEIDVDAIMFLKRTALGPQKLLEALHAELEARARTQGEVERRNRCVTVHYADQNYPSHMDVTPAVPTNGNVAKDGQGPLEVPDYNADDWHPTNPKDFADWFNAICARALRLARTYDAVAVAKAATEALPSHADINAFNPLRAAVKLLKRHRDQFKSRQREGAPVPISVIITTLVAKAYDELAKSQTHAMTALEVVQELVRRMPSQFDQIGGPGAQWVLSNPRRPSENFAEKWNRHPEYALLFAQWHAELTEALALGQQAFIEPRDFEAAINKAFGPQAERRTRSYLNEAAARGQVLPGLAPGASERLAKAGSVESLLTGLAQSNPEGPARPKPTGRLG